MKELREFGGGDGVVPGCGDGFGEGFYVSLGGGGCAGSGGGAAAAIEGPVDDGFGGR